MSPKEPEVGYRRNGKRQACEPCRKGKLACDHGAPHCGRCVRRKTTAKCIYHPAPMTKVRNSTNSPNLPKVSRAAPVHTPIPNTSPQTYDVPCPPQPSAAESSPYVSPGINGSGMQSFPAPSSVVEECRGELYSPNTDQSGEPPRKKLAAWKTAVYPKSAKYYGPTSFSAVFLENKTTENEDILDIGEDPRRHPGSWVCGQPLLGRERPSAPGQRTKSIVRALWNIPSREVCENLLSMSGAIHDPTLNPIMIRHCVTTFWDTFGPQLTTPLTAENLTIISEALFKNEEHPLPPAPEDGLEWLNTFMGPNLRFEMLGVLFCFFGKAYLSLQDWDPMFKAPENNGRNRKETAWRMKECADACRKTCHFSETVNEVVVALTYNIHVLESSCTGNESYLMRHRHGHMVTSTVNAGLHRLPDYTNTRVTTASEYKRRLFSAVYYLDKTHSALNGLPPMLGRLYCDVRPPLDLSDDELFLPPHALAVAISRLDFNGWNTEGNMYDISVSRAIWQLSAVREEILELALGVNVLISDERVVELRQRSQHVLNSFPNQLLYCSNGKMPKDGQGKTLFAQATPMLDFLQNMFLIERVALARGFSTVENLLSTAMDMLDLSLMFWIMRDQLVPFTSYFDWIITFYGIPSAGVICVELLSKQSAAHHHPNFSRSDAIQKLTLFIGFLEWIRPTDGNYRLAGRLRKVIRRVLDHVLEPPNTQSDAPVSTIDPPFDPTLIDPPDNLNDMDWLSSIDWTHGSWIGL